MRPTYAEIDLAAIHHNMREICGKVSVDTNVMAVVKADAYGHGALPVAQTLLSAGATSLAVAIPEEGVELRQAGITPPIILLGHVMPEQNDLVVKYGLIPAVSTLNSIMALDKTARELNSKAKVFIAVDTGMGRIGLLPDEVASFVQAVHTFSHIEIYGMFTHLASADETSKSYAEKQLAGFNKAVQQLSAAGLSIPYISAANSATIMDLPSGYYNTVRPGIILYGLPPSHEIHNQLNLRPAMSLKTKISHLKKVPAGTAIGYGSTYTTSQETYIATLPIGYADGYSRLLSNKAPILIGGQRHRLVGRVCMDQIMVDLGTETNAKIGDEAVLFGRQGTQEITVTELADLIGTINYELVCAVSKRVPRVYVNA